MPASSSSSDSPSTRPSSALLPRATARDVGFDCWRRCMHAALHHPARAHGSPLALVDFWQPLHLCRRPAYLTIHVRVRCLDADPRDVLPLSCLGIVAVHTHMQHTHVHTYKHTHTHTHTHMTRCVGRWNVVWLYFSASSSTCPRWTACVFACLCRRVSQTCTGDG